MKTFGSFTIIKWVVVLGSRVKALTTQPVNLLAKQLVSGSASGILERILWL